jgi:drug/metabolite transporter (DMT)-like permease
MTTRFTTRALLALAAALLLWASAFAGIRAGLRAYSPGQLAVLRFVVASVVLAVYASVAHFRRPEGRDIPGFVLSGIIGISFYNLALNYGETRVTAGAASLLIASVPIWTALLASFTLHERLTPRRWMGILVSFAGVALITSGEGRGIHISPPSGRGPYSCCRLASGCCTRCAPRRSAEHWRWFIWEFFPERWPTWRGLTSCHMALLDG